MMKMNRRSVVMAFGALAAGSPACLVHAQQAAPLEWVVGYAAGGGSDAVARLLAEQMGPLLGRVIVVTNKPGAATNIAAEQVARSKDHGNVMFTADLATLAANPWLFGKLRYNAETDFIPVGTMARFPMLLVVHPDVPAKDYREFAAWARGQPGGVDYGSAGPGSPHHLAAAMLRDLSGLNLTHIPYRGAGPVVQDLMGGQVRMAMMDTAAVQQAVFSGRVRALGVASAARLATMPEVPTLIEQGLKGMEVHAWQGLVVPAGTSPEFVAKLNQALNKALQSTQVRARFQAMGLEPLPGTPSQMASFAKSERERWGRLIKAIDLKLD
jgi:tripartite-type tricarboxylate transporter receptor subunit TctC